MARKTTPITRERFADFLDEITAAIAATADAEAERLVRARYRERGAIFVREYTVKAHIREAKPRRRRGRIRSSFANLRIGTTRPA